MLIWRVVFETKIAFVHRASEDPDKPSMSARAAQGAHHHSSSLFTVTIHDRNREREEQEGIRGPLASNSRLLASKATAADEAIKFHTAASKHASFVGELPAARVVRFDLPRSIDFRSGWSWIATWRGVLHLVTHRFPRWTRRNILRARMCSRE